LCYLEGLTNEEAARQLGCPKGTVLSRLTWARQRLRDRLARRGVTLSASALTVIAAPPSPAAPLVATTGNAATLVAAGNTIAGAVSAQTALVVQGVLREMFLNKLKIVAAVLLGITALTLGVGGLAAQKQREPAVRPAAEAPRRVAVAARQAEDR